MSRIKISCFMDEMLFRTLQGFSSLLSQPSHTSIGGNFPCRHRASQGQAWRKDELFPLHHFNVGSEADENGCMGVLCEQMKLQPHVFTLSLVIWYLALVIPPALELGMENMRALFHSKGLETHTHTRTSLGYLQMVFALHWSLTPDRSSTRRLCTHTHTPSWGAQHCSEWVVWSPNLSQAWSLILKAISVVSYLAAPAAKGTNNGIWKQTATASCKRNETLKKPIAASCITAVCCSSTTGCWAKGFIKTFSLTIMLIFQVLWKTFLKHLPSYLSYYKLSATQPANSKSKAEHKEPPAYTALVAACSGSSIPRLPSCSSKDCSTFPCSQGKASSLGAATQPLRWHSSSICQVACIM